MLKKNRAFSEFYRIFVLVFFASLSVALADEAAPERTPAAATYPKPVAEAAGSAFKFSGFFDFRFSNLDASTDPHVASSNAESGFALEDGAFYMNYDKEKLSVVADLAFRRAKDSDVNPGAGTPNQSNNNFFSIGVDKSQLYGRYKLTPELAVSVGQFDSLYGVEAADSKDRLFGKTGIVGDSMLPATNAGVLAEYTDDGITAKAMASNPNNKGTNGSSTAGDDKTEYGLTLGYSNDWIHGQIGAMSRSILKADNTGLTDRVLLDATLGVAIDDYTLDLEYDSLLDPSKNTLTPLDSTDSEDPAVGIMVLASYKITDPLMIGLRYEEVENDPTASGIKTSVSLGGSIHYKVSSELELRAEYIGYDYTAVTGTTYNDTRYNLAALFSF
ncbi:MAG: outer membrane beta-barrel protein [Pseudobdellovibrio sp.]